MSELSYAVLVETENGSFFPVSFGDTEWECIMWLKTHEEHYTHETVAICHILDTVIPT